MLHPFLTLAAIIITANHYWLDAAVALCIFLAAVNIDRGLRRRFMRLRDLGSSDETADSEGPDRAIVAA